MDRDWLSVMDMRLPILPLSLLPVEREVQTIALYAAKPAILPVYDYGHERPA